MDDQIKSQFELIDSKIRDLQDRPPLLDHGHNGYDSSRVNFWDLDQKTEYRDFTVTGSNASINSNYGTVRIMPYSGYVVSAQEIHQDASSVSGTLNIVKLTGTQALGSGVNVLASGIGLTTTANTVQTPLLTTTLADRNFVAGDRLALVATGTLTSLSNVTVFIETIML